MTASHPFHPAAPVTEREIRAVFIGLMIVLALAALDQSIVATALPRIVADLGGLNRLSWVVSAYVLASTTTMPLYGKLADQYGRRPLVMVAIVIFLVGSALSGAAASLTQLILFRAVQGVGAGGLMPLAQIIIGDLVPPAERGRRQGAITAVFALCSVLGPVLGGIITDLLSWHWIFYVNLPVGVVALVTIARALRRPHAVRAHRIDYAGAALLTSATTAFLLVLAGGGTRWPWISAPVVVLAVSVVALTLALVRHLGRAAEPVLPPALFRDRVFVVACVVMVLALMGMMGASLFFPLFFQLVMGASAADSGLYTAPLMVGLALASTANGRLLHRTGRYKAAQVVGLGVAAIAFAILAWAAAASGGLVVIEPVMFALGAGLGLVMPNMTIAVQNALDPAHRGVGTATLAFFRSLGGLVGVTAAGAILTWSLHQGMAAAGHGAPAVAPDPALVALYRQAIARTFAGGAVVVGLGWLVLWLLPELPLRAHQGPHAPPSR